MLGRVWSFMATAATTTTTTALQHVTSAMLDIFPHRGWQLFFSLSLALSTFVQLCELHAA